MELWNSYDGYLFDIDGTLLNCEDAVHYYAFCETLSAVAGRSLNLNGVTTHGNTDIGILRDAFALNDVDESRWRPHLASISADLCRRVLQHKDQMRVRVLPGVTQILEYLHACGKATGVASGNLEAIGWTKVECGKLLHYFTTGTFSGRFEHRCEIFRAAANQMQSMLSARARICVIGDTCHDIEAARLTGLNVVAVATGTHGIEDLLKRAPDICVSNLEDTLALQLPSVSGSMTSAA